MKTVLDRLEKVKTKLDKYHYLQSSILTCEVDEDPRYRTAFIGFYTMAWKSPEWYNMFFLILEREKRNRAISFRSVLEEIFDKAGRVRVEASFCSKLIATINPDLPVWDKHVLANVCQTRPSDKDPMDRLNRCIDVYSCIKTWSEQAIQEECFEKWRRLFDDSFPQFQHFTDIKKLDLFLWQYRQE